MTASNHDHGEHEPHVIPLQIYFGVWIALMVLTWITVAVTNFDFGGLNIWIAMAIATVKASLVVLFFMHLAFDRPVYAVVLIISLLFTSLFLSLSMMDTHNYGDQIRTDYETLWDKAAQEAMAPK